jgi:hypothetical protein
MLRNLQPWKFAIAIAVIGVAVYVILYGPHSLLLVSGVALAVALFWVRCRYRMLYGAAKLAAGAFTLWHTYTTGRGAFSSAFSEDF